MLFNSARVLFRIWIVLIFAAAFSLHVYGQETGKEMYDSACSACHGTDGKGKAPAVVGFDIPLPDFTDCSFASRETDDDWLAIIHEGGPTRAFDSMMPSFGEALKQDEMRTILGHVRTFCKDSTWPRGELNLPRALVTEKAFPEDESVLSILAPIEGLSAVLSELIYERRFGSRNQIEFAVPFALQERAPGSWVGGVGDIQLSLKRTVFHSFKSGSILSLAGEVTLPTGNRNVGLGDGLTVFEPFVAFGQMLPSASFVQFQGGLELPADRSHDDEAFWRTAVGKTVMQGGFGRSWTPMIELLGARELVAGAKNEWHVVPQIQISLSRRQHILLNAGFRVPVTEREVRNTEFMMYLLWDWFDGGLFSGWK